MKEIIQQVDINLDDDLHLWIEAEVDGETVYSERGHSFTVNFLSALYSFMSGERNPLTVTNEKYGFLSRNNDDDWQSYHPAIQILPTREEEPTSSGTFRTLISPADPKWATGNLIQIGGVAPAAAGGGITGWWILEEKVATPDFFWLKDPDDGSYLDVVDIGSLDTATYTPVARKMETRSGAERSETYTYSIPQILIGYSNSANIIDQRTLNSEIFAINNTLLPGVVQKTGSVSISTPTIGSGQSVIEIEQSFVNGHASVGFDIQEVGLVLKLNGISNDRDFGLMARDVLSLPLSVGAGQTVTLKYRIIVRVNTTSNDGGFLAAFNEILYRQISQLDREAKDIFNNNVSVDESPGSFMVASTAGDNQLSTSVAEKGDEYVGPQIGHSTKIVANTDFRLQYTSGDTVYDGSSAVEAQDSRYAHGRGDYQVQCHGPIVHGWEVNSVGGYAQFKVDALFHNLSNTDLVVNEIGFYISRRESGIIRSEIYAMCRNRLTTPFTLTKGSPAGEGGEIVKVTYIFRVNI